MSKLFKSKILLGVLVVVAMFAVVGFSSPSKAAADCSLGSVTLRVGSTGASVACLQAIVGATADGKFGPMTQAAVMAWQSGHGLVADGVVGPLTKAAMGGVVVTPPAGALCPNGNTLASNCLTAPGASSSALCPNGNTIASNCATAPGGASGVLSGGAGSVESYQLVSSLSNEEVGEGLADVKVYGLEIEAGDSSDLSITAAKLVFDEGAAATASNFKDYADEVSVWMGSTKVGTVDSDKFTDDNAWTYTVSLSGATIPAGTTGNLYVAISGVGNLDTADAGDTWTLDVTSIRWVDASGTLIAEDPAVAARTFSFETTAVSADTEFKVYSDDMSVNDAHVLDIHPTEATANLSILSFKVKIFGTQDVQLKDLPVLIDVTGQDQIYNTSDDGMVEGLSLWMDGSEVSTVNMTTDCVEEVASSCDAVSTSETYIFHDIDTWLKAGQTYHFLVKADISGLTDTGDVAAGHTIGAAFTETQQDSAGFDAEDETGTNLVVGDKNGAVTSTNSEVRDVGINVVLVGTPTAVKTTGDPNPAIPISDSGTFTITFDATAFGADMYVDATAPDATPADPLTESDVNVTGTGTLLCTITSPSGATLATSYLVREGETERFAVTCSETVVTTGFFDVTLTNILYAITDAQTAPISYTFNLTDFKTPQIFLDDQA